MARKRQATSTGGVNPQLVANLPQGEAQIEQGKTRDIVAKKVGRRIKELERLYGIENGGKGANRYLQLSNKSKAVKSQDDVASDMNISVATLQNYKLLADMIPELSDLVDTANLVDMVLKVLIPYFLERVGIIFANMLANPPHLPSMLIVHEYGRILGFWVQSKKPH